MAADGVQAHLRCGFELPRLVRVALTRAHAVGFTNACLPEQGRLLEVLARGRDGGRVGETGTGCGVGLAWMAAAVGATTRLVSVERDPRLAAAASEVFRELPNVTVLRDDWSAIVPWAPFDLLVLDAGGKVPAGRVDPAELLKLGGVLVIDDFTPMTGWPPRFGGGVDAGRMHWFQHPRLLTTEIRLTRTAASLVAVRR